MNPPRILHLIHHLHYGGAESQLVELLPRLARAGFDVQAACLTERGPLADVLQAEGVPVHAIGRRRALDAAAVWRLQRLLRRERIALLNTHSFSAGFWGRLAAVAAGTPRVVTTVHTVAGWSQPLKQFVGNQLLRPATDRVVAVSACVRRSLIGRGRLPPARVDVIPNGLALARFAPVADRGALRRRLGLPAEAWVVGTVSRCSAEKGGIFWLEALARLAGEGRPVHGVLVGDGPDRGAWRALAIALGLAERVTFAGAQRDVPAWLAACDAVACPSQQEAFGLAALEAQAAGVPVVATRVDGFRETLHEGEDALLVPPGDGRALAAALGRLHARPELAQNLIRAGRLNAARFPIEHTVAQYAALYRALFDPPSPR